MKVLITAPSLDETENISGISSVVRQITSGRGGETQFVHFVAGRRDGAKTGVGWIFGQTFLIPRFLAELRRTRPDVIHINTALTTLSIIRDWALTNAGRSCGYPVLLHIHGGRFFTEGFRPAIFARLTRRMLERAGAVVVLSEREKMFVAELAQNLSISVLENAVPFDQADVFERTENAEKTITFLGRLHEGKGLREIAEACRLLRRDGFRFRFACYGTGPEKDGFIGEMTGILGDRFYYGGVAAGAEKWKILAESDIFLLPSHYEGLPLALLEAMAAGSVPVVSAVGSVGEVVSDGFNGFLTEPRNVSQIAEKLKVLLSGQADWRVLRENAQKTIRERFDLRKYIEKLEQIYQQLSS